MLAHAMMQGSVTLSLLSPFFCAIILAASFFLGGTKVQSEKRTYRLVRFFYVFSFGCSLLALISFLYSDEQYGTIGFAKFQITKDFAVDLRLFFDAYGLIFLTTCTFITAVIIFFSHRYLHRDPGYRRFFTIISFFAFGTNLIVLAGTFDLIFAAWEILGLSSFLLIGYFWHRPKAIGAACRAYYIYRMSDVGLLASLMITHYVWHDISIFSDFLSRGGDSVLSHVSDSMKWILSVCILLPVLGKSAQFPLCFWLPKAMEGPTHSSAIFYGSLSIHAGVFLLIRTMPIWYYAPGFVYLLGAIGLITAICATLFATVQSNIKGQIGYASIAQVGLMLVELAFGLVNIAFIHLIGNAFLRCFQLLVSSSILTTHLHMQSVVRTFGGMRKLFLFNLFPKRLQPSIYVFAINDGFFESALTKLLVTPSMAIARSCNLFLCEKIPRVVNRAFNIKNLVDGKMRNTMRALSPVMPLLVILIVTEFIFRSNELVRLSSLFVALIFALSALGEQKSGTRALVLAALGNLFAFLSITSSRPGLLYLIGLITSALIALDAMRHINMHRTVTDLKNHQGLYQQFPLAGTMLLIGILGIVAFPISCTFYGEDILLGLSMKSGFHHLIIFQLIFIISGIAVIRFYSLIMFGRRDNCMNDISLDYTLSASFMRILFFVLGNAAAFMLAIPF